MNRSIKIAGLIVLSLISLPIQAAPLHIHVLNVGEGQSVLLHQNQHAILIDTGHAGQAYEVIERMQQLGIQTLDHLILTHLHPDHASGFFTLQHRFPASQLIDNCQPVSFDTQPDMIRWVSRALDRKENRRCVSAGDHIDWQGITLQFLWPRKPVTLKGGFNHQSLVIYLEHNQQKLLVMGDADLAAEKELMKQNDISQIDVLVVGHHGSKYASSDALLGAAQPEYAVISVNANNFRGYPDANTVSRIGAHSKQLHKTWIDGEFHHVFN